MLCIFVIITAWSAELTVDESYGFYCSGEGCDGGTCVISEIYFPFTVLFGSTFTAFFFLNLGLCILLKSFITCL